MKKFFPLLLALVSLALLSACTANKPHRTNYPARLPAPVGAPRPDDVVEVTTNYTLGFVEFDDLGWFWDRKQWETVQRMVTKEIQPEPGATPQGVLIMLFVHGWKNNAAADCGNVLTLRGILTELKKAEDKESAALNRPARKVVGVYAGWRGLSAKMEPFKELSFFERKNTSHTVGAGAVTEVLVGLEHLVTVSNRTLPTNAPKTQFTIIGHSFGGAAVYSAVSQVLTERFIDNGGHQRPIKPLGNLVILLNPAFEASRHNNLNELATSVPHYATNQRPVLAIFTSKADWATRVVFPMGRFFSTLWETCRKDRPQMSAERRAVGHYSPYVTHDLIYDATIKTNVPVAASHTTLAEDGKKHALPTARAMKGSQENVRAQRARWRESAVTPVAFSFDDCTLRPRATYHAGNPFLVVSVEKKIMRSHDDIANPILMNFLREFIFFSQTNPLQPVE